MSIREKIKQLEMEREELKADLFDALAEQAEQIRLWTVEGIPTPLEQRLELQAEIKDLEAERQRSKVELMRLKVKAKQANEQTYYQILKEVMTESLGEGAEHILDVVHSRYHEQLQGEMMTKKYLFASLRGEDFEIEGATPQEAWENLVEREKDSGSLWKAFDPVRNRFAVEMQGFEKLGEVAYKEVK